MRKGFTLIELLVVISIIALLIAILLPALAKSKESTENAVCQSGLRQLAIAQTAYAIDHKTEFADSKVWVERPYDPTEIDSITDGLLYDYMGDNADAYLCPVAARLLTGTGGKPIVRSYSQNHHLGDWPYFLGQQLDMDDVQHPSELVMFSEENAEATPNFSHAGANDGSLNTYIYNGGIPLDSFASFHNAGDDPTSGIAFASFVDGSVKPVDYKGGYDGPFTWENPETGQSEQMSRSTMWCRDDVPNED